MAAHSTEKTLARLLLRKDRGDLTYRDLDLWLDDPGIVHGWREQRSTGLQSMQVNPTNCDNFIMYLDPLTNAPQIAYRYKTSESEAVVYHGQHRSGCHDHLRDVRFLQPGVDGIYPGYAYIPTREEEGNGTWWISLGHTPKPQQVDGEVVHFEITPTGVILIYRLSNQKYQIALLFEKELLELKKTGHCKWQTSGIYDKFAHASLASGKARVWAKDGRDWLMIEDAPNEVTKRYSIWNEPQQVTWSNNHHLWWYDDDSKPMVMTDEVASGDYLKRYRGAQDITLLAMAILGGKLHLPVTTQKSDEGHRVMIAENDRHSWRELKLDNHGGLLPLQLVADKSGMIWLTKKLEGKTDPIRRGSGAVHEFLYSGQITSLYHTEPSIVIPTGPELPSKIFLVPDGGKQVHILHHDPGRFTNDFDSHVAIFGIQRNGVDLIYGCRDDMRLKVVTLRQQFKPES